MLDTVTLVKMGGSVITHKNSYRSFSRHHTEDIAAQVAEIKGQLIIVHGGGSFGHVKAREYFIPGVIDDSKRNGSSLIHDDMLDLSGKVARALLNHGMAPYIFPTSSLFASGTPDYTTPLYYMKKGYTPILFGDTYLDGNRILIYSGDSIMLDLARLTHPSRSIFFSDVDGVFTDDPKRNPDARLIPRIHDGHGIRATSGDATGGMKLKLSTLLEMKKHSSEVYLINGKFPERIRYIGTKEFIGTVIE